MREAIVSIIGRMRINISGTGNSIRGTRASDDLDFIRGLSAVAVLANHARVLILCGFQPGDRPGLLVELLYRLSGFGHQAVIVFFVLSGYFVGSSVIRSIGCKTWSWGDYIQRRAIRLYVVLVPALILTFAWDRLALVLAEGRFPGQDTASAIISVDEIRARSGIGTALGNSLFLQDILTKPFGSNNPLWSLSYEAWYYLAFSCLRVAVAGRHRLRTRLLTGTAGLAALTFTGPTIAAYFPIWLMSAAAALIPLPPNPGPMKVARLAIPLALAGFVTVMGAISLRWLRPGLGTDYVTATAFAALLVAILLSRRHAASRDLYGRSAAGLAAYSFTLYAAHLPPLIAFRSLSTYERPWPQDNAHWLGVALLMAAVMAYAYAISLVTEAHTERVRRRFAAMFFQSE